MNTLLRNRSRQRRDCRAFVLLVVLIVMASAILAGTMILFLVQAETAGAGATNDAMRSRSLHWSGVQVVMQRLNAQRDVILEGGQPELESQYEIYESDGWVGVVRLLPMATNDVQLISEASKVDLNSADAETLAKLESIDEELAASIIEHRQTTLGGRYQSVVQLLDVEGVTPEMLYGPLESFERIDTNMSKDSPLEVDEPTAAALSDDATVYAFEPNLQRSGKLRIDLNVPWSDELGRRLDDRFGEGTGQFIKFLFDDGVGIADEAELVALLRQSDRDQEEWPDIIDAISFTEDKFVFGKLDINSASSAALQSLPEVTPEIAEQLVELREQLSVEERATIAWPVIREVIPPEQFQNIADRMTARSWTYRMRIASGEVDAENSEGPLRRPTVYEVVIDLSAPQPRIAYMRDISLLRTTAMLAANAGLSDDEEFEIDDFEDEEINNAADDADADRDESFDEQRGESIFDEPVPDADPFDSSADAPGDDESNTMDQPDSSESAAKKSRQRIGRWSVGG